MVVRSGLFSFVLVLENIVLSLIVMQVIFDLGIFIGQLIPDILNAWRQVLTYPSDEHFPIG